MNSSQKILQLMTFLRSLNLAETLYWEIPCLSSENAFDISWSPNSWRYKNGRCDWLEATSSEGLILTLNRNDVDIENFAHQLTTSILSKVIYSYDIVQEACRIFGEDIVYFKIGQEHSSFGREIERLITSKTDMS